MLSSAPQGPLIENMYFYGAILLCLPKMKFPHFSDFARKKLHFPGPKIKHQNHISYSAFQDSFPLIIWPTVKDYKFNTAFL